MVQRRRHATREELVEVLSGREPDIDWVKALAALEAAGVDILVEITVDEEA